MPHNNQESQLDCNALRAHFTIHQKSELNLIVIMAQDLSNHFVNLKTISLWSLTTISRIYCDKEQLFYSSGALVKKGYDSPAAAVNLNPRK